MKDVRIIEIFCSVQGETSHAGVPCAFVRLARCNLRCTYCDTEYSFGSGDPWTHAAILDRVHPYGVRHVCITGGEPMLQREHALTLMGAFLAAEYTVMLETHGAIALDGVPDAVVKVVDVKTPAGLGMDAADPRFAATHFHYPNLDLLTDNDEVKFVVTDRSDYEWSRDFVAEHQVAQRCGQVLFSPSWGQVDPADLVAWMLADHVPARLNLQVHKVIWGADASGV